MYLMPQKRSRRLSALMGFLPVTTPGIMPRRIAAINAATLLTGYGVTLGALPTPNVTTRRGIPALAARLNQRTLRKVQSRGRRNGSLSLGDSTDIDWVTGLPCDDPRANCGTSATSTPSADPNPQPSGAVLTAYKNILTSAQNSSNPLDYVSPQAAIATGLDRNMVNAAWAAGLARFKNQQDALAAGIPAGVVTQLWNQSRGAGGTGASVTSWLTSNWMPVAAVAGGVLLIGAMKGRH